MNKNIHNRANICFGLLVHFSLTLSASFYSSAVFLQTALICPMENGQITHVTVVYTAM